MKSFPIPAGADSISTKAIKQFEQKLRHMMISKKEIQFIIDGVMKLQVPRDQERARKAEEKMRVAAERRRLRVQARRSYYSTAP